MKHWIFAAAAFALTACNRELPSDPPDTRWFPVEDGRYRTYDVQSTTFQLSANPQNPDTILQRFYKRELTNGETDLDGRRVSRLELWEAPYDSSGGLPAEAAFSFQQLWTQYLDEQFAERIEGNVRYVVLKWPVATEQTWNGNTYNDQGEEIYTYLNLDTTVTLNGQVYPNCIYVLQRQVSGSILSDILTYEIYAPGIGKIERFDRNLLFILQGQNPIPELDTESYLYHETLVDHNYDAP